VETERSGGKYVNTPQTIIYDKSRVIYGLYQAKSAIKSQDLAVVVEGQMDVISCHQQGMKNVVAASGTALTQNQVKLLRRYSNNVAICFDADSAGQNADKRGIAVALEEGMNVKVIRIPAAVGKDADEIIKKNPAVWFKAVAEAEGVMEWYFASVLTGLDRNNPQAMTKAANELIGEIVRLPQPVERDYWLRQLGERLDIEPGVLRDEAKKIRNTTARGQVRGAVNEPVKPAPAKIILRDERYNLLLEVWWALVLKFPELFGVFKDNPLADLFSSTAFSELYELCVSRYNNNEPLSPALLRLPLKDNSQPNLVDILLLRAEKDYADFTLPQARGEAERLMESIRREWIKNKRQRLQKQIEEAEKNNQPDKLRELWQEFQSLSLS